MLVALVSCNSARCSLFLSPLGCYLSTVIEEGKCDDVAIRGGVEVFIPHCSCSSKVNVLIKEILLCLDLRISDLQLVFVNFLWISLRLLGRWIRSTDVAARFFMSFCSLCLCSYSRFSTLPQADQPARISCSSRTHH